MIAELWKGEFGDAYTKRNIADNESNTEFFRNILKDGTYSIGSIMEFGCGKGANLRALELEYPKAKKTGVEINQLAIEEARNHGQIIHGSLFDYLIDEKFDLVLTKGLLIHIEPEWIREAYRILYEASSKYILICEYYSKQPQEIEYRGQKGALWKRDFCGEIMDQYKDLELVDYGFVYDRDPYPQDSINWWLLEK
jgi:pseudaminic acid biosynthesis-associated methylase